MQVKAILNRIEKHRSFVYESVRWVEGTRLVLEVEVRARANTKARCSGCGQAAPGYDTLAPRRFEFVPLWGIAVFFVYAMRRVACGDCGVKVEAVPWASGKRTVTESYAWFLARWARRVSWKEVAEVFHTSWEQVFRAVARAVEWGRAHQDLSGVSAIGIDELARQRGHRYLVSVRKPPLLHEICDEPPHFRRGFGHGIHRTGTTERRLASNPPVFPTCGHRRPFPSPCAGRGGRNPQEMAALRPRGVFDVVRPHACAVARAGRCGAGWRPVSTMQRCVQNPRRRGSAPGRDRDARGC